MAELKKVMEAEDWEESKIKFPVIAQCKIDGVRGVHLQQMTGRRLKPIPNKFTQNRFNDPIFKGFDGELAADIPTHPDLCRLSTSAFNTHDGEPNGVWYIFDYITEETIGLPYKQRLFLAQNKVFQLNNNGIDYVKMITHCRICNNMEELLQFEEEMLELGYEGICFRDPNGKYKQGRSTVREGGLMRIKRMQDSEAEIIGFIEANKNNNEATIDERGRTKRSSHQDNLEPKGMVGSFIGRDLKTSQTITIAAGKLTHDERIYIWNHKDEFLSKISKYRFFGKGIKDLPRFPRHISWREEWDMGETNV